MSATFENNTHRRRRARIHAMSFECPLEMRQELQRRARLENVSASVLIREYVEFGLRRDKRVAEKMAAHDRTGI